MELGIRYRHVVHEGLADSNSSTHGRDLRNTRKKEGDEGVDSSDTLVHRGVTSHDSSDRFVYRNGQKKGTSLAPGDRIQVTGSFQNRQRERMS